MESWKWDKVIIASKNADGGGNHNFPTAELMERALSKVKCVLEIKSIRKAFRVKRLTRARLKNSKKEKSEKLRRSKDETVDLNFSNTHAATSVCNKHVSV